MKTTNHFQNTIKAHLDKLAKEDPLFASVYAKEGKSIEDCCIYILNQVRESGCSGFDDAEIFNMAIHYWDEDDIEIGKHIGGKFVVNHTIELTDEEKENARQDAIKELKDSMIVEMKKKTARVNPKPGIVEQQNIFDL